MLEKCCFQCYNNGGGEIMRCSCQRCGAYMVQDEKGVQSRCICPECFFVCSACIGTSGGQPLDLDSLRMLSLLREAQGDGTDEDEEY